MTSLLARFGQLEARAATQTLWRPGKRKRRGDWVCVHCRAKSTAEQTRRYSDNALRLGSSPFGLVAEDDAEDIQQDLRKRTSSLRSSRTWDQAIEDGRQRRAQLNPSQASDSFSFDQNALSLGASSFSDYTEEQAWESFERVEEAPPEADAVSEMVAGEAAQSRNTAVEIAEDTADTAAHTRTRPERDESLLELDYAAELSPALLQGSPDLVARCIFAATRADDLDFIRSIPATTFSEIISLLAPSNFISKLSSAHLEISDALAKSMNVAPMQDIAWEYQNLISEILAIRRSAGVKLGLADYRVLMRSAQYLGSKSFALSIWRKLHQDGLVPDTACYNAYMASLVWNGVHRADARHRVRVIPFHMLARQTYRLGKRHSNYRVVGDGGIRALTMKTFGEMLRNGAVADSESFRIVITAAAREGEMSTVKSVFKKVWQLDVDALMAGKSEAELAPKKMTRSDPLYPDEKLLFAIAHAFGINNDIPTALRLVDFTARHYSLDISTEVWEQLFEWTFVLAARRTGTSRRDGSREGQLPAQSVESLWQTMTSAPYHVKPTMGMYNHLIKNLWTRLQIPAMYEKMEEGRQTLHRHVSVEPKRILRRLAKGLDDVQQGKSVQRSLEIVRRDWEDAELIRKRGNFWVKRWLRLLLASVEDYTFTQPADKSEWGLVDIPRILWDWRHFAPTRVRYSTSHGVIDFNIRSEEELLEAAERREAIKAEQQEVLDKVKRYVGDQWVARTKAPPKRLLQHRWEGMQDQQHSREFVAQTSTNLEEA